ncbi:host specificity protein J [Pleomorphomonas koreensis]|uniref:host specificity protein J n=1 Tax=Pleomorphomonas koreensis TaxID=257440 RepID=UPI001AEBE9BB|nr:phage tail protein [Pleomorphomonas koreensis]
MNAPTTIPVLAAPLFDPGAGRVDLDLPAGLTVAQIVALALPEATERDLEHMRVTLVTPQGMAVIEQQAWSVVRPKPGVRVVIRIVPGKQILKAVLMIVVSIAAIALGQLWAPALAGTWGLGAAAWAGIIGAGITVVGSLLINALIPPAKPKTRDTTRNETYTISGWQNRFDPDGVIPEIVGTLRYAPPFAARSYSEIVGDVQYIRAVFCVGYGGDYGLTIDALRIGETAIEEYDEVEIETREGLATDQPLTLYPRQVVEESVGAELVRPLPRDDAGNVISGASIETPVVRTTGADASGCSVIIGFPGGLGTVDDNGNTRSMTVSVRIRQRRRLTATTTTDWAEVVTLNLSAAKLEGIYRQYSWEFGARGRYEIELTRLTNEQTSTRTQARSSWLAIQTQRPEYPLAFPWPLALVALRVKATYQLNGSLDNFNALISRRCLDWDAETETWVARETQNPASIYRYTLQSPSNPRPVTDVEIDLDTLADWHTFCATKGLKYDASHDDDLTLRERLAEIAVAGRASPRHDGKRWSVVIDRPQTLVIDHINPRNSWDFRWSRTYFKPPHGFRVKFQDATNDYKQAERLVPWPGHSGPITLSEQLELPGKTDPDEIWVESRRRMYEALYRPDTFTCMQDGPARVATRGDLVAASYDVLERTQVAARVVAVSGDRLVVLDDVVTMVDGRNYGIRFRVFADEDDTIGISVLRPVLTIVGEQRSVLLEGAGDLPIEGDIVHFGELLTESLPLIITRVEAGEEMSSALRAQAAAPIIDELTDEEVPPAWSGRAGSEVGDNIGQPPAPKISSIKTGVSGTGVAGRISVLVSPGSGAIESQTFKLEHRLNGATTWTIVSFPAVDGGVDLDVYATGDPVQLRAYAVSPAGVAGPNTTVVMITVGGSDKPAPTDLDDVMISIAPLLGGAVVMFSSTGDINTVSVRIYRSTSSTLDRDTDLVATIGTTPSQSYSQPIGDSTRETMIAGGSFASGAAWTYGADWDVAAGVATHTPGDAGDIAQALAMVAGKTYRVQFTVSGRTAGSVQPMLQGGTSVPGAARSANGLFSDRLVALSGNDTFALMADADFDGSIDDVVVFVETATCLEIGTHHFWLEPFNSDGLAGPTSGPFNVSIR